MLYQKKERKVLLFSYTHNYTHTRTLLQVTLQIICNTARPGGGRDPIH